MNLLAIDTSTKNFSLAVLRNEKIIAQRNVRIKKVLSSSIIPNIDGILKKAKTPLNKLDGFAVGLGPGSFTSLRVGLATVKSLAFATGKPVVGISSLDAIAAGIKDKGNVCVIADAKRKLVYAALYQKTDKQLKRKGKYLLTDVEEVIAKMPKSCAIVGDGIEVFRDKIGASEKGTFVQEKYWYPKAMQIAQLARPKFLNKKYDKINKLNPLYLYPKDCQVRK